MNWKLILLYFPACVMISVQANAFENKFSLSADSICSVVTERLPDGVHPNCSKQLLESCHNRTVIATLIDATSKFPYPGVDIATREDYGNFDQCLSIDHSYSGGRILGKHCFPGFMIPDFNNLSHSESYYKLSVCQPDLCTAEDLNAILPTITINGTPIKNLFLDVYCTTKETHTDYGAEDYVTIFIIGLCIALMIISTAYDLYLKNYEKKASNPLFLAFSVYTNGKKLFQTSKASTRSDQILIFHGLKTISMMWVISGHGVSIISSANLANYKQYMEWRLKFYPLYLSSAVIAVETFFFISGFLMAYQYLKIKSKPLKFHIMGIPMNYIHRYIRLTPAVLMVYLVTISIYPRFARGPMTPLLTDFIQKPCRKYWYSYFLYIQNYNNYNDNEMCWVPTWYLSADMQMFILSPFIMIPLAVALRNKKNFKLSMIGLGILSICAVVGPIIVKLCYRDYKNQYDTHSRLVAYVIGITMGTYIRETKDRPFLNNESGTKNVSRLNLILWILNLVMMGGLLLWYKEVEIDYTYEYFEISYMVVRFFWAVGLCWMVYSSYYGYGGFINWILTRPLMQIGGKLAYCMYLLHPLVIFYTAMLWQSKLHFSDLMLFQLWCGYFILSIIAALFWTLAFESPLIILEKFIFGGGGGSKKRPPAKNVTANPPSQTDIGQKKDLNANEAP